jgi:hypothetical protein
MKSCCICGKDLPGKYAEAGRCDEKDCERTFCSLHWHRSNRRCSEHGYVETIPSRDEPAQNLKETEMKEPEAESSAMNGKSAGERAKAAMTDAIRLTRKLGIGAMELFKKLKKDRSPQAMMATLESSLSANAARGADLSSKLEQQFKDISAKKKVYETAPPARKRILEAELQSQVAGYRAAERELKVLLENQRVLSQVKGRMHEVMAYGMAGVGESVIDDLTDQIEEAATEAEGRVGAADDLEKAGRRREKESSRESFMDQLGEFSGEAETASAGADFSEFAGPEAPKPPVRDGKPGSPEPEAP